MCIRDRLRNALASTDVLGIGKGAGFFACMAISLGLKAVSYTHLDDISDQDNDSTNVRTAVRLMQPYGAAYAYTDHIGIQRHIQEIVLRTDESSINLSLIHI